MNDDEVIISLDVTSLYTNIPVEEAIDLAADSHASGWTSRG